MERMHTTAGKKRIALMLMQRRSRATRPFQLASALKPLWLRRRRALKLSRSRAKGRATRALRLLGTCLQLGLTLDKFVQRQVGSYFLNLRAAAGKACPTSWQLVSSESLPRLTSSRLHARWRQAKPTSSSAKLSMKLQTALVACLGVSGWTTNQCRCMMAITFIAR